MVGLVEAAGDSIKVGGRGVGGAVGVGSTDECGAMIIGFGDEPIGKEAVRVAEGTCDKVWESSGNACGKGVWYAVISDGEEASGGHREW